MGGHFNETRIERIENTEKKIERNHRAKRVHFEGVILQPKKNIMFFINTIVHLVLATRAIIDCFFRYLNMKEHAYYSAKWYRITKDPAFACWFKSTSGEVEMKYRVLCI